MNLLLLISILNNELKNIDPLNNYFGQPIFK